MGEIESILNSIKKLLGIDEEYTVFDVDIMIHINSALAVLKQLGVGPAKGFIVDDDADTWKDFLGDDPELNLVKSYVYMKVKLIFDPPQSSAHIEALKQGIAEFEWRANVAADPVESESQEEG